MHPRSHTYYRRSFACVIAVASHHASVGIEYVIVNGVVSLDHGKVTGKLGGRPLRGPGYVTVAAKRKK